MKRESIPAQIKKRFETAPPEVQRSIKRLRELILDVAREEPIGGVSETLKWNAPSYMARSGKGTTVRLEHKDQEYFVRVHCQSRVVEHARASGLSGLHYDGSRGLRFNDSHPLRKKDEQSVRKFVRLALTYHSWK